MSRKLKKGYYVKGQFVAEGSELDLELKRELKGTDEQSRTDLKRESTELQKLGEALLTLRADLMARLNLSEKLVDALAEARRITNFEGKRRQMQFIGKLMRLLTPEEIRGRWEATPGRYTVRNLTQNTAYTICFTADSPGGLNPVPVTANFNTTAAATVANLDWIPVGITGLSAGEASSISLASLRRGWRRSSTRTRGRRPSTATISASKISFGRANCR